MDEFTPAYPDSIAGANGAKSDALSVSAALAIAKGALEQCTLTVIGEVSEVSKPGYAAMYFTVKDEKANLPCLMWTRRYEKAGIKLSVGMLVQVKGNFTVYAPKGRMNFDVSEISLAGEGDLRLRVANLAKKLAAEGLTDQERKRPIGKYFETIGLVTSPRGAAVYDVLRTLRRRYPVARVLFAGVGVEGEKAPDQLMEGLRTVAAAGAEVILLVRGGGSFEDLMPFNDERLARAIAQSTVPIVTGIGHEPDTSIADMVSDLRASTPTAAAEAVSPKRENLDEGFKNASRRMARAVAQSIEVNEGALSNLASRPIMRDPDRLLATEAQMLDINGSRLHRAIPANVERDGATIDALGESLRRVMPLKIERDGATLDTLIERLNRSIPVRLERECAALDKAHSTMLALGRTLVVRFESGMHLSASRLDDLSPLTILARGYSIARKDDGAVVRSVQAVKPGQSLQVTVADGRIDCLVDKTEQVETSIVDMGEE